MANCALNFIGILFFLSFWYFLTNFFQFSISEATNMLIKVLCKAGAYPIEQKGYGLIVFGMNKKAVLTKIDALQLLIEIYDAGNHLTNQKIVSMETIECFFQELFHICPVLRKKAKHCKKLLQLKFTTMYTKQQDSHLNVLFVYKNKDFYLTFTPDFQMKMLFNQGSCLQYLHDEKEMIDFFLNF